MEYPRVLGIYAHPDDADVGAGGTLARLVSEGTDVKLVVVTSGDAGGFDPGMQLQMSEIRRAEQMEAAANLGITNVVFLEGYADGDVTVNKRLVRDLVIQIRAHQPTLITTMSPEFNLTSVAANHPDHRAVGAATVEAVYPAARNPFSFPELVAEGLEPWTVKEVWFQGHKETNHYVALSEQEVAQKNSAIRCHNSQFQDFAKVESFIDSSLKEAALECGVEGVKAAERFFKFVTG